MKMKMKLTPLIRQYLRIKAEHQNEILFFHLGDFYETFFEDAEVVSKELDIVLTKRNEAPMAGVPIKKADYYINQLLKAGYKVAVCDQVEDPLQSKGLTKREVVRVITPGTVVDEELLQRGVNNYIAAVFPQEMTGLAFVDISTGEFCTTLLKKEELNTELFRLKPSEMVIPQGESLEVELKTALTEVDKSCFNVKYITEHFGEGLELPQTAARTAAGLLCYLKKAQKETLVHLKRPLYYTTKEYMTLDPFTQRNLELLEELRGNDNKKGKGTLFSILNKTTTAMGERLLRRWLLSPLVDRGKVEERLNMLEAFHENDILRAEIRQILKSIHDVERLAGRLSLGRVTPRDLLSLKHSLDKLPSLKEKLKEVQGQLKPLLATLEELEFKDLTELLDQVRDDAPSTLKEGGIIKPGKNPKLDALIEQEQALKRKIIELEQRERSRTKINLKVGYNNVFGYYIEVTKANINKVPPDYQRKQTLVGAERYITPELKEYEEGILSASQKAKALEYEIFCELREKAAERVGDIQGLAEVIAQIDVFAALAEVARLNNYCRPSFKEKMEIDIKEGRHPVVESEGEFVPNDMKMEDDTFLIVLTGPNMSGKSVYTRQIALIVLMAQVGSFVPASSASLPIVDKIFTRVGATDMLVEGYSTFMMEMLETASILNSATKKSLIILDEMGRGTSTFDGVSIAWAVAEHLATKVKAKTLFATHYHELTKLADKIQGVKNMNVLVKEYGDEVIFLHRVVEGVAEGSYGVWVAKLAGLPEEVTGKASLILDRILKNNPLDAMGELHSRDPKFLKQLALFTAEEHPVIKKLKEVNINTLTPLEALELVAELKKEI
jgi:DNA mismatch repair protein MutS